MMKWWNYSGPCEKECPKRAVGCQGKCEKYAVWKTKLEAENAKIRSECRRSDEMKNYYRARKDKRLHAESRKSK